MTDNSDIIKCHECGAENHFLKLSPAVIDGKLKLVCENCWASAVKTGRATIFTKEELSAFSEFKSPVDSDSTAPGGATQPEMTAWKVTARLKELIENAALEEVEDFEQAQVDPMLSTVRDDGGILCLKIAGGKFLITVEQLKTEITEDPPSRPKDILDSDVVG
jgi:hypothetical protein